MKATWVALTAGWARRRVSVMFWAASLDALAATRRQREEIRMRLQYGFGRESARIGNDVNLKSFRSCHPEEASALCHPEERSDERVPASAGAAFVNAVTQ